MSKWDKVPPARKKAIFAYNKARAADIEAAADMRIVAEEIGKLPPGQRKKVCSERAMAIFAKYGVVE